MIPKSISQYHKEHGYPKVQNNTQKNWEWINSIASEYDMHRSNRFPPHLGGISQLIYPLVNNITLENHEIFIGKSAINGPFSIVFCMFTRG